MEPLQSHIVSYQADVDTSSALDQSQSVLFAKLPAEVRGLIFKFALTSTDDVEKPYRSDRIYYRPGFHFHQKIDCSLLRTCKRVFQEARLMPVSQVDHIFWLFKGPSHITDLINKSWSQWQQRLNLEQRISVTRVHLFLQQYALEGFGYFEQLPDLSFHTKLLKITLRHSDWWTWSSPPESSDRLGICPWRKWRLSHQAMTAEPQSPDLDFLRANMVQNTWGWQIGQVDGIQTLKIEFETDEVKKVQLQAVLDRAQSWRFPLADGKSVLEPTEEVVEYTWEGVMHPKDNSQPILRRTRPAEGRRRYYVVELTWRRVFGSA